MDDMDVSDAHFPVVVLFVELLTCYRSDCQCQVVRLVGWRSRSSNFLVEKRT